MFTNLPRCRLTNIYIYTLYRSPAALCHSPECLITVAITLLHKPQPPPPTPPPQKKVVLPPAFLKILQYSQKKSVKIFKNTFFKEHLRMAASELNLRSHLQPSRISNITEIPVAFKPKL